MDSVNENEFKEEQKSSKDEVKGGYSSAKEGGGAYLAPMGKVPSRDAEKGKLGVTLAGGRGPLTRAEGWRTREAAAKFTHCHSLAELPSLPACESTSLR